MSSRTLVWRQTALLFSAIVLLYPQSAQKESPEQVARQARSEQQVPKGSATAPPVTVKSEKDGWDKALVIFTGLIVIVGGFQIYFLCSTVEATKENAKAARLQAEALIIENRPWLLIMKIEQPNLIPAAEVAPSEQRLAYCCVWTENFGKTPAKVITQWGRLMIGDSPLTPPKDLNREIGITAPSPEPYVFPPTKSIPAEAQLSPEGFISPQARDDVIKRKVKYLWLCGFVKYQNTFVADLRN